MKVALLGGHRWLEHEGRLLRQLVVGLADETVRPVPVVPRGALKTELPLVSDQVEYRASRWPWLTRWRLHRLRDAIQRSSIELIHVVDGEQVRAADSLARQCGTPLAISCWSEDELAGAISVARRTETGGPMTIVTVPTQPLQDAAARWGGEPEYVRLVRPGVMRPGETLGGPLQAPEQSLNCVVLSTGAADPAAEALLQGVAHAASDMPQLQLFVYCAGSEGRELWRLAMRHQLLDRFNLVGSDPSSQSLLLECDAVLTPQPLGVVRSLVLSAMAAGRPVIGVDEPIVDYLHEGRTAHLIEQPTAEVWADTLRSLTDMPEAMRQLGRNAQQYVGQHHSVAEFVEGVLDVYRELLPEPLSFEART